MKSKYDFYLRFTDILILRISLPSSFVASQKMKESITALNLISASESLDVTVTPSTLPAGLSLKIRLTLGGGLPVATHLICTSLVRGTGLGSTNLTITGGPTNK